VVINKEKKRYKIAIVDDEKELVEIIKNILEERQYSVCSAYDGKSGLEMIKKENPDLVLLDIVMPELDGRDLLLELKKINSTKDIPVIMFTVRNEPFEIDYGIELGADDYLPKPCDIPVLIRHIDKVLRKHNK
jgi:DNA-binding response OmpR family regulator